MSKTIDEIVRFQTDRNLDKQQYEAINGHANIVEELLESIGLDVPKANRPALKAAIVSFVEGVKADGIAEVKYASVAETPVAEQADAYVDIIVFSVGELMKLGYHPERAMIEGAKEINSRVGTIVDGKFEKDLSDEVKSNWYTADYDGKAKL